MSDVDTTGRPTSNPRYVITSRTTGMIRVRTTTWEHPQPDTRTDR